MKWFFRVLFFIQIIGFTACQKGIKEKLYNKIINECSDKDTCLISINSVTNFVWDTLYIFSPSVHLDELDKTLGFHYPYWEDIADRIIFTSNRKVVYHEDHFPLAEKSENDKIYFLFDADSLHYMKVSNKNANFLVLRKNYFHVIYELKRIKSAPNKQAASMRGL